MGSEATEDRAGEGLSKSEDVAVQESRVQLSERLYYASASAWKLQSCNTSSASDVKKKKKVTLECETPHVRSVL